jgi:hypothetical protein
MICVTLESYIFGYHAEGLGNFVELFVAGIRKLEISLECDDSIWS